MLFNRLSSSKDASIRFSKPCRSFAPEEALRGESAARERGVVLSTTLPRERFGDPWPPSTLIASPGLDDRSRFERDGDEAFEAFEPESRSPASRDCGRDGARGRGDVGATTPLDPSFFCDAINRLNVELNLFFT